MVNVLKEIGIQQWRLRSVESVVLDNELIEAQVKAEQEVVGFEPPAESSNIEEKTVNFIHNSQGAVESTPPPQTIQPRVEAAPVSGFSGSLKQALTQSKAGSGNSISSSLATELQDRSKRNDISNNDAAVPEGLSKKAAVPLNLSELIDSDKSDLVAPKQSFSVEVDAVSVETGKGSLVETDKGIGWNGLHDRIKTNEHCPSCGWGNAFLGSGNEQADWLFIVDAPNMRDVDAKSMFSGRAGQLFDAMLSAAGLYREQVYATSVFKCAPTDDLSITPQCDSIVRQQIKLVEPKIIITFGEFAAQAVTKSNVALKNLRSKEHYLVGSNTPIIPTYSPAQMLDDTSLKAFVWQDLKKALRIAVV